MYLTGRDPGRVAQSLQKISSARAQVRGEVPDVSKRDAVASKIGQVAAVRVLAAQRRAQDLSRGILIASISPGLIDTGASRAWLDLTNALQPDEVAGPLIDFALGRDIDESLYGELVHVGREEPGMSFGNVNRTGARSCRGSKGPAQAARAAGAGVCSGARGGAAGHAGQARRAGDAAHQGRPAQIHRPDAGAVSGPL